MNIAKPRELRQTRVFSILFLIFGLLAAACGEPDDRDPAACTPGATQACVCTGGLQGAQTCSSDGSAWTACNCGVGPGSDTGGLPGSDAGWDPDTGGLPGSDAGGDPDTGTLPGQDSGQPLDDGGSGGPCPEGSAQNACGGCAVLAGQPGGTCGECDGTWACDGRDAVVCQGGARNACGGCMELSEAPGSACGAGNFYACDGIDTVSCQDNTKNACGGSGTLQNQPGTTCGACGDGAYVCGAPDLTVCKGASAKNDCGGCNPLAGRPGAACANGGTWVCNGQEAVQCSNEQRNACGGTQALGGTPGRACGPCMSGTWICEGAEAVTCFGAADLNSDPKNCGACGTSCTLDHAFATCSAGSCTVQACKAGWGDCDGNPANGCEQDLNSPDHCGVCNNACAPAHGTGQCNSGMCAVASCAAGWSDCDAMPGNGCEQSLSTTDHCGACGAVCSPQNASGSCGGGMCQVASCSAGFGDCDSKASTGCEQTLDTLNHCGACDNKCELDNATAKCAANDCAIASCDANYGNCDMLPANGCEVALQDDALNCGACGNMCDAGDVCVAGACEQGYQIAAGSYHTCYLDKNGTIKCWGSNGSGRLGNGQTQGETSRPTDVIGISDAVAIRAGSAFNCALRKGGGVFCWGSGYYGQLGHGITTSGSGTRVPVSGLNDAVALDVGSRHACAVRSNGNVVCWGHNYYGELGDGTTRNSPTPVTVTGITNAVDVGAGQRHSCAVLTTGEVKCWGDGSGYVLGNGTQTDAKTPVTVKGLSNARQITSNGSGNCVRTSTGRLECWGNVGHTSYKSVSPLPGLASVRHIALGSVECAIKTDGTSTCWGSSNHYGQLGDGSTTPRSTPTVPVKDLPTASFITHGGSHGCAVTSQGDAFCWGRADSGKLGDNAGHNVDRLSAFPVPDIAPITIETGLCSDGKDNDGDGKADCADPDCATDLGTKTGTAVGFADTCRYSNYFGGTCAYTKYSRRYSFGEKVYSWTAPSSGTFVFDTNGSSGDHFVYLRQNGCGGAELACDRSTGTDGKDASVEATLVKGQRIAIFVDSDTDNRTKNNCGPFLLNIGKK